MTRSITREYYEIDYALREHGIGEEGRMITGWSISLVSTMEWCYSALLALKYYQRFRLPFGTHFYVSLELLVMAARITAASYPISERRLQNYADNSAFGSSFPHFILLRCTRNRFGSLHNKYTCVKQFTLELVANTAVEAWSGLST